MIAFIMHVIESEHLRLLALNQHQLGLCLNDLSALECELGVSIKRDVIDENVVRALRYETEKDGKCGCVEA